MLRVVVLAGAALTLVLLGVGGGVALAPLLHDDPVPPGAVDVGFAQDMMVHHQQAVSMSQLVVDRASTPVSTLARQIEAEQSLEIGQLQGLLLAWEKSPVPDGPPMTWMPGDMAGHPGHEAMAAMPAGNAVMPGMATQAELDRLRSLTGADLDVSYLQLMLRHHEGGVPMLAYAAQHASTAVVRDLANRILVDQVEEGQVLLQLLHERGAQPLPSAFS